MAVVLFFSIILGSSKGKALSQAETVVSNFKQLEKALEYFYNDQDRFPTAGEFTDPEIFGRYLEGSLSNLNITTKTCAQSFIYNRISFVSYKLQFCLPAEAAGYKSGWNQKIESK